MLNKTFIKRGNLCRFHQITMSCITKVKTPLEAPSTNRHFLCFFSFLSGFFVDTFCHTALCAFLSLRGGYLSSRIRLIGLSWDHPNVATGIPLTPCQALEDVSCMKLGWNLGNNGSMAQPTGESKSQEI